jgi:hypothetical protein
MARGAAGRADKEPTFQEFIHFLLNTEIYSDDEHWQPIALRCRSAQPIGEPDYFTPTNTVFVRFANIVYREVRQEKTKNLTIFMNWTKGFVMN